MNDGCSRRRPMLPSTFHPTRTAWMLSFLPIFTPLTLSNACFDYGDDTFPGLLIFGQKKTAVCEKIYRAIIQSSGGPERLLAQLPPADFRGSTAGVSFNTVKTCWTTDPTKCHFNLVPQDSDWESAVCQRLEAREVPVVPIHVQEKIQPLAIIEDVRRRSVSPTRQRGAPRPGPVLTSTRPTASSSAPTGRRGPA